MAAAGGAGLGTGRLGGAGLRDRIAASDPGLTRLGSAARAAVGVGSSLVVEYLVATALGFSPLVPMMLGAVLSMMTVFGVADPTPRGRLVTTALLPLFMLAGMGVALAVDSHRVLSLVVFVVVMFVAVAIRRFGLRYFAGGMLVFMGYFFSLFLLLKPEQLPEVLVALAVATVWTALLLNVLWPVRAHRVLARMVRAFEGRVRGAVDAAADVLDHPGPEGERLARLESRLVRVTETALMIDGQLGTAGAVLDDATARTVRHALVDDEISARALADSVRLLSAAEACLPADVATAALRGVREVLAALSRGDWDDVEVRARALDAASAAFDLPLPVAVPRPSSVTGQAPPTLARVTRRIAAAAQGLVDGHRARLAPGPAAAQYGESGFEPAVVLFAGAMPGSAGTVAEMLDGRSGAWWTRLSLTTRQAFQVAIATGVAIAAGDAISGQRYYWAVLAAFIVFTGTATAAQTVQKAVNRVLGTIVGLFAAIPLVALTGGRPAVVFPVLLVAIFAAFYIIRVSYAVMTFFVTLLLGELYALLGTFTPELMMLRLEETALGGTIGILVALFVFPMRTRVVAIAARRALLGQLRELVDGLATALRDPAAEPDLTAVSRVLDARLHQLLLLGATLLRPAPFLQNSERGRRLMIYTSLAHHARSLARLVADYDGPTGTPARALLVHVTERIVDLIDELCADEPRLDPARSAATSELLSSIDVGECADPRIRRFVHQLGFLHDLLASLGEAPGVAPEAPQHPGPVLHGRVRDDDRVPVQAVLTLTDTLGVQQGAVHTAADGSYRLTAADPGVHLLICSPDAPGAAPLASWVRIGERAGVHDVDLPGAAVDTTDEPLVATGGDSRPDSRGPGSRRAGRGHGPVRSSDLPAAQPPAKGGRTSTVEEDGSAVPVSRTAISSSR
ncbi:FUSC family protein [Pseudonocardia ailaonensis]|uniref:FUSC family protein n=1 Tax=Pseudonocardia ailaonensis TaxID=367279 RepID=A0ABN2NHA2_9PSEU